MFVMYRADHFSDGVHTLSNAKFNGGNMFRITKFASVVAFAGAVLGTAASAGTINPEIIFGSGNTNRGFTVNTVGDLELGLRAKRRYTDANDALGVGIVQDAAGNYLFDSTGQTVTAGRSLWNFDWSINSDVVDGSDKLSAYTYVIAVDYDGSAAEDMETYDPLGLLQQYYLGDNSSGNGGATQRNAFSLALAGESFDDFNVAQQSVNLGFLDGSPDLGAGQFRVSLTAFKNNDIYASTSINVFVDTLPPAIPLPAGGLLLVSALGGLVVRKKLKRAA